MKIVFDNVIFAWQKAGGISVFWGNLIEGIAAKGYKVVWLEPKHHSMNFVRKALDKRNAVIVKKRMTFFKLQRYMNVSFRHCHMPFIFHSSYYRLCRNRNAINVITVHDFVYEKYVHGISKFIHCMSKKRSIRKADAVVCISESTKKDLMHYIPNVDKDKIHIIYNGVGTAFYPLKQVQVSGYLLFVGSRARYKNFDFTVRVASMSKKKLVIVGQPLSKAETVMVNEYLGTNFEVYSFVSDEELNILYNKALAFIYPSSYEGFGIPILEAQRSGCPVIAQKVSSIPEIIGDYPLLIDKLDEQYVSRVISELECDTKFRQQVIEKGIANAGHFSWEKMSSEYLCLYENLLNKNI